MDSVPPEQGSAPEGTEGTIEPSPVTVSAQSAEPHAELDAELHPSAMHPAPGATHVAEPELSSNPSPVPASARELWTNEALAGLARGIALWILLGLAAVTFVRLVLGRSFVVPLLEHNTLEMRARVFFIAEMLIGGGVFGGAAALFLFLRRRALEPAIEAVERYGWFFSPLILLPMIPVAAAHEVWVNSHRVFLPIVLFGAVIAEFFFTQAALAHSGVSRRLFPPIDLPPLLKKHGFLAATVAIGLAYGAFMSFFTVRWHHRLGTAIFDLGINNNLIHGGLSGRINYSTVIFPDAPVMYWANHVKLGLFMFLPIYAVFQKAETLLIIQSVSLGLGAIPLFLFARRRIPEWSAFVMALAYLCYVPMHAANFYEMKEPPTAAAFVLTMVWALDSGRYRTTWVFFFMSLIMREDMPIPLAMIGMVLLLSGYRPRMGAFMTAIASVWFVILRFKIMNEAGAWWFPNMYESLWSQPEKGFQSVIKTLLSNPSYVLRYFFVEKKFWYLMHLMVPVVFLPGRRWYLWAAFVPGAILTLLVTDYDPPILQTFQYTMHWGPYLFLASILAIEAFGKESVRGKAKQVGATMAVLVASLALNFNYGAFTMRDKALQSGYAKIRFSWSAEDEKRYRDVLALVAEVPKTASVAATEHLGAHFAARKTFYTLRRGHHDAEFIAVRKTELKLDKTRDSVKDALKSKKYGLQSRRGEFVLLKRGGDPEKNDALLEEFGLGGKGKASRQLPKAPPEPAPEEPEGEIEHAGGD